MSSPIGTGGAGVHIESWIAAYYLAAVLTVSAVRGLPTGATAISVKLQRTFEGQSLDDVIVSASNKTGDVTLSLQVKRTLTFGDNQLLRDVARQCWETFDDSDFRQGRDRFGVAIGTPDTVFERGGRNVLHWARQSCDAADFFRRINAADVASEAMRDFVKIVRRAVEKAADSSVDDTAIWRFLAHFVVLSFDFEHADESYNRIEVTDRLRFALPPEDVGRTPDLWQALVDIADRAKSAAGSLDRAALCAKLLPRFELAPSRLIRSDLDRIQALSRRALDDIRTNLGDVHLARSSLLNDLEAKVTDARLVELVGEAGSGKSAIAREFAERRLQEGPVLFLSSKRMPSGSPGWDGLAALWGLKSPLDELLAELGCVAEPCLFLDGVERLEDPGAWLAINDILREIRRSTTADRWTVVLSVRANSLNYRTQLDLGELEQGAQRVLVGNLTDDEISEVATAHPQLAALIEPGGRATELAKRPFLLDRLLRSGIAGKIPEGPASEVDLMLQVWTGFGRDESTSGEAALACQDLLLELGRRRLADAASALTSIGLTAVPLRTLVRDDVLQHDIETREITFAHDTVEDWVLCQTLRHHGRELETIITGLGEPLWLLDAVQLLAQWHLERNPMTTSWEALLAQVSRPTLQPRWRRAVLTAPLRSTRAASLLEKVSTLLWRDGGDLLAELMVAMRTVEVEPNPVSFDAELFPDYDDVTRMQLAHAWATPRMATWRYFFVWLIPRLDQIPPERVYETTRVIETWAKAFHWFPAWAAPRIVRWARNWLDPIEFNRRRRRRRIKETSERLSQLGIHYREGDAFRDRLRLMILSAADGAQAQVADYLCFVAAELDERAAKFIVANSNWLVDPTPVELVDFLLAALSSNLRDEDDDGYDLDIDHTLGIKLDREFYPASHLRPPFLLLLRRYPEQGLRLVDGLCNSVLANWRSRQSKQRDLEPLPVTIDFSWGKRQFWGHAREYLWFRGMEGPNAVMSALMALEVWMEERLAGGDSLEELIRKVLTNNDSVGAVGTCVSLCLANPNTSLHAALPFATSPQIWEWDLERALRERTNTTFNLFGLPRDRTYLRDVEKRNKLGH